MTVKNDERHFSFRPGGNLILPRLNREASIISRKPLNVNGVCSKVIEQDVALNNLRRIRLVLGSENWACDY